MKRALFLAALVLCLLAPATALAKHSPPGSPYVPPNQSAASQYTEDVPTAGGNVSVTKVAKHPVLGGHGSGSGGSGGSSIPNSTLQAMSASGASGSAAASLAAALAPAAPAHHRKTSTKPHAKPTVLVSATVPAQKTSSAAHQVVDSLTGAGGGLGGLLPVILIGSLVLASGAGIVRIFRPGPAS